MAKINNQINPTNDPNFTGATRPISIPSDITPQGVETNRIMPKGQEIGDRSAEYEGKAKAYASEAQGASTKANADLFAGVVGVGDFLGKAGVQMVKKDIEDQVYNLADAERQQYTQTLQSIRDGKGVQNIISPSSDTGDGTSTPSDIKDLPDQLSVLQSAKDGGKLRSTDYRARLSALAKDLRAKYPGFRQEIDSEFAKVTGSNPANAVVTGLIADINAQAHGASSEKNVLIKNIFAHQGDFDDPVDVARKVDSGEYNKFDVMRLQAPRVKMRADISDKQAVFNDQKLTQEQKSIAGADLLDTAATAATNTFVNKFMKQMGLETDAQADTMSLRTKSGEINSGKWQELGQLYAQGSLELRQRMWSDALAHGMVKAMGAAEVNKHIDAAMERVNVIKDRIYAADVGGIHNASKIVQAMQDDDTKNALEDPIIGAPFRLTQVARKIGGDQWMASTSLAQSAEGLNGKWAAYGKSMQDAIAVQKDMQTSGVPLTLNRVFDSYGDKMKNATDKEKATVINSTVNRILSIADPNTPEAVKVNYATAAFSENSRPFITRLNQDSYDSKGRPTRGQNAVFQDMSSEAMTKSMHELGKKYPQLWQKYTDFVTQTLGNNLISRDARYLDQIRNPAISVGWDSDNHRFVFDYKISPEERSRLHITGVEEDAEGVHVRQIVNRLNNNISGYKNIAKATGADVDAFVLGSIAKAVGPESLSRVGGIPANIIRDIGLARLKKKSQ